MIETLFDSLPRRDPPTAVAAIFPTFMVRYPVAQPTTAPTPICLGAGALDKSLIALLHMELQLWRSKENIYIKN